MTTTGIPTSADALVESVYEFNRIGQVVSPGHFNADRVGFYFGMILEEVAEGAKAISEGAVDGSRRMILVKLAESLDAWGKSFKAGEWQGEVLRCDREGLLDGSVDITVVALGCAMYQTPKFREAIAEVLSKNAEKIPNGVATRDENNKLLKPAGWTPPNHGPFVDKFCID